MVLLVEISAGTLLSCTPDLLGITKKRPPKPAKRSSVSTSYAKSSEDHVPLNGIYKAPQSRKHQKASKTRARHPKARGVRREKRWRQGGFGFSGKRKKVFWLTNSVIDFTV